MILIRANCDTITYYMYRACIPIIEQANRRGFKVIKVESKNLGIHYVRKRIERDKPRFFFFNGHGNKTSLFKDKQEVLISIADADLFAGMIAYTRACDSVCQLGQIAVNKGCRAFIGYKRQFWIPWLKGMLTRSQKDEVAQPVIESSNIIARKLVNGYSVDDSIKDSHDCAAKYIVDLIYSNDPYRSATLPALVNNDLALTYEGDGSASL